MTSGRFGGWGGMYAPETLVPLLQEVDREFAAFRDDVEAQRELDVLLTDYAGRPTPLYRAARLSEEIGCRVYLKREDLLHGGAHKTNNCLGQGLLARRMGRRRLIAETGAGQHGFATAMVGALLGLETVVYMGARDIERQRPNVLRMELCGARVEPVHSGAATLKEAINEAFRDWIARVDDTYYLFGTVAGPHPFPSLVAHFQSVIGREAREQILAVEGRLPRTVVACVGGGSNAIGAFRGFVDDPAVELVGVEPGGAGLDSGRHGATLNAGTPGVFHGSRSYLLCDDDGQVQEAHSISAGLDYPGVGPEHAWLQETGRARYGVADDDEALAALERLCRLEGIIPALESSHALAWLWRERERFGPDDVVLVNLSGRGDKDLATVRAALDREAS